MHFHELPARPARSPSPMQHRKPAWFRDLFGFDESSTWGDNVNHFQMDGDTLVCRTAPQFPRQFVGRFECPSVAELRSKLAAAPGAAAPSAGLSFAHLAAPAGVGPLHYEPSNAGAVFQAASQFNCLEMTGPNVSPTAGVGIYINDRTQGPACALACPAATVYRNYLVQHEGNTGQHPVQIDNLKEVGVVVGNNGGRYWVMQNGYAMPVGRGSLAELAARLRTEPNLVEQAEAALRVGVHWETSVAPPLEHRVCQVYASALPCAYARGPPESDWEPFARLVLRAAYEATLAVGAVRSLESGGARVKCYLTALGEGVFGNRYEWIRDAILDALDRYQDWPLDVVLVHFGSRVDANWARDLPRQLVFNMSARRLSLADGVQEDLTLPVDQLALQLGFHNSSDSPARFKIWRSKRWSDGSEIPHGWFKFVPEDGVIAGNTTQTVTLTIQAPRPTDAIATFQIETNITGSRDVKSILRLRHSSMSNMSARRLSLADGVQEDLTLLVDQPALQLDFHNSSDSPARFKIWRSKRWSDGSEIPHGWFKFEPEQGVIAGNTTRSVKLTIKRPAIAIATFQIESDISGSRPCTLRLRHSSTLLRAPPRFLDPPYIHTPWGMVVGCEVIPNYPKMAENGGGKAVTFEACSLPAGLRIDGLSGCISGHAPLELGRLSCKVRAANSYNVWSEWVEVQLVVGFIGESARSWLGSGVARTIEAYYELSATRGQVTAADYEPPGVDGLPAAWKENITFAARALRVGTFEFWSKRLSQVDLQNKVKLKPAGVQPGSQEEGLYDGTVFHSACEPGGIGPKEFHPQSAALHALACVTLSADVRRADARDREEEIAECLDEAALYLHDAIQHLSSEVTANDAHPPFDPVLLLAAARLFHVSSRETCMCVADSIQLVDAQSRDKSEIGVGKEVKPREGRLASDSFWASSEAKKIIRCNKDGSYVVVSRSNKSAFERARLAYELMSCFACFDRTLFAEDARWINATWNRDGVRSERQWNDHAIMKLADVKGSDIGGDGGDGRAMSGNSARSNSVVPHATSAAEDAWARLAGDASPRLCELMAELFAMVGLDSVKDQILRVYNKVVKDEQMPEKSRIATQLNFTFMGNPGTGEQLGFAI